MNVKEDTYLSIAGPSEGLFKDRGSRFIALAFPVQSEEQVKALLEKVRREYHDAKHHCLAFRLGREGAIWRASDDGEPSGSAGRPILAQIDSASLSDVAVIVVRYFGGVLLGVPGLINAYRSAAADALEKAVKVQKTSGAWYRVRFEYGQMPSVMKLLKDLDLPRRNSVFGELECSLEVRVRDSLSGIFFEKFGKIPTFIFEICKDG